MKDNIKDKMRFLMVQMRKQCNLIQIEALYLKLFAQFESIFLNMKTIHVNLYVRL